MPSCSAMRSPAKRTADSIPRPSKSNVALTTPLAPLARLRQWLTDVLVGLTEDVLHDVLLICSELVANAYNYARRVGACRAAWEATLG